MERKYDELTPKEVEYILVKTTSGGPYVDDVFFLIFTKDSYWEIPQASGGQFLDWLKQFSDINMEQFIKSMASTDDRIFILYRGAKYPVLSERNKDVLKNRLMNFLSMNFESSSEDRVKITDDLFKQYQHASRHYHNMEHIQNCLWELDQLQNQSIDKPSIELAIWYHDVIYSPASKSNEIKSAKKMKEELGHFVSKIDLDDVSKMIQSGPRNDSNLTDSEKYFFDIDYSILGQREFEYMAYRQNVRLEFIAVPSWIYHLKRKSFLKNTLKNGIYQTEEFRARFEETAVKNILSELSKMPYKILPTIPWKGS